MSNSRPKTTTVFILVLQLLICVVIYLLFVCIRRWRNRRRQSCLRTHSTVVPFPLKTNQPAPRGLPSSVIDSFPVFPYSAVNDAGACLQTTLDCAVCMSAFTHDETLRFIPKCCHVFHPQCVDPWLAIHTTCPYCRVSLSGGSSSPGQPDPTPAESGSESKPEEVVVAVADTNDDNYTLRLSDEAWSVLKQWRLPTGETFQPAADRHGGD